MRRTVAAIALIAFLLVGGGIIASAAYQMGVSTAIATTVTETGATVVVPPAHAFGYGPGYGYGPGWGGGGFGFFGFLGTLLFIFIIFGLIRAAFFRGSGRGWGGPGGPGGWGGPGSPGYDRWQGRAKEVFDDLHKDAHATDTKPPSA